MFWQLREVNRRTQIIGMIVEFLIQTFRQRLSRPRSVRIGAPPFANIVNAIWSPVG